jgi:hypothetical protein
MLNYKIIDAKQVTNLDKFKPVQENTTANASIWCNELTAVFCVNNIQAG